MASASAGLDQLISVVQGMARQQRDSMDEMNAHFSDRTVFLSGESLSDFNRRARLRQKELDNAKKSVTAAVKLNDALEDLELAARRGTVQSANASQVVVDQLDALSLQSETLTQAQTNEIARIRNLAAAGQDLSSELLNLRMLTQEVGKQERELIRRRELAVKYSDYFNRALEDMRSKMTAFVKENFTVGKGLAIAAMGAKQAFDQLEVSLEHQVPIMDSLAFGTESLDKAAASYGLTVDGLMQTQNKYSQAILASAEQVKSFGEASSQYLTEFGRARDALYNLTGNYDKASELFGASVDLLSFAGVKQGMGDIVDQMVGPGGFADSLKNLATLTNLSAQQIADMNKAILADKDIRYTMISLDKQQRKQRLSDMLQYQHLLVTKGMEIDQAVEATKAMQKLTASMSPKERYKQAAKIRAIAGAQGVAGGEDFMRLSMKNPAKWTDKERETMQQFATQLDQSLGDLAGSDNIGAQMMGGAFQDAISGSLYDSMIKAQSTAGLEAREIDKTTVDNLEKQTNQLQGTQNTMVDLKQAMEKLAAWSSDAGVKLIGGTAMAMLSGIGTLVTEVGGILSYMAMSGGLGGAAKGLGKAGLVGAAGVAGYAAGSWLNDTFELSTKINDGIDKLKDVLGDKKTSAEETIKIDPKFMAKASQQKDQSIKAPMAEIAEQQQQYLDKMMKTGSPEMKALAEQLKSNNDAMKKMSELMQQGMAADKAALEATKQNTNATKENTVKSKNTKVILRASPGRNTAANG